MLVIGRRKGEVVVVTTESGERLEIMLTRIQRHQVRLGFSAGPGVKILRAELEPEQRNGQLQRLGWHGSRPELDEHDIGGEGGGA